MTTLEAALDAVAYQLNLDPVALLTYAAEDTLPGYYDPTGDKWSVPFAADGKFLYALIRALKPRSVLEIGTAQGGSARHILEALAKNDSEAMAVSKKMGYVGILTCVDINTDAKLDGIPSGLLYYASNIMHMNSDTYIQDTTEKFDFIHEDGAHSIHNVQYVYNNLPKLMPRGGVILSHDVALGVGDDIRLGMRKAGFENVPEYLYDGSPCGFTVLKYEGNKGK